MTRKKKGNRLPRAGSPTAPTKSFSSGKSLTRNLRVGSGKIGTASQTGNRQSSLSFVPGSQPLDWKSVVQGYGGLGKSKGVKYCPPI